MIRYSNELVALSLLNFAFLAICYAKTAPFYGLLLVLLNQFF